MDIDAIKVLGGGGVISGFAVYLLKNWFTREKQESSLYKNEVEAHMNTREQLKSERELRRSLEVELRDAREVHDNDREAWFAERQADREAREEMQVQIMSLRDEVRSLNSKIIHLTGGGQSS